jgi:hypothetical protein
MKTALFEYSFAAPLTPDAILFLEQETNVPFHHLDMREWLCVTAWNDHGAVVGVLTMEPRNWFDWHMSCAIADQRLMNRKLLRAIFRATFSRAKRITALVEPNNERVLAQTKRLGRRIIEGTRDAYMFAMLAEDCPWLHPARRARHGEVLALSHPTDVLGVNATELAGVTGMPGNSSREGR